MIEIFDAPQEMAFEESRGRHPAYCSTLEAGHLKSFGMKNEIIETALCLSISMVRTFALQLPENGEETT